MPETFVPLCDLLRAREASPVQPEPALAPDVPRDGTALDACSSDLRWFRARLAEVFEDASARLLEDLACDVLARELVLAPADVAAIAARALKRACEEVPIALRVHPDDAARAADVGLTIVSDPSLRAGDLVVDLSDGEIDVRLGVRLEGILQCSR